MERNEKNNQQSPDTASNLINKGEKQGGRAGHNKTHDISHIDRQEGTMNNGMLGGNLNEEASEEQLRNDKEKSLK